MPDVDVEEEEEKQEKKNNNNNNNNNNDDTDDTKNNNDVSKEAAGVVRGVSRSIVRGPLVGRLPKSTITTSSSTSKLILRQRLPVKQVAKVSDRLATGKQRQFNSFFYFHH